MTQRIEIEGIGVMSGTSLDGVDIAYCKFVCDDGHWNWTPLAGKVYPYPPEMLERLKHSHELNGHDLAQLDVTVFHEPQKGLTLQIGSGAQIAAASGIDTICDFRTADVAHGGNGAPLVPIGDKLLYGSFDYCLNLGGFANISYDNAEIKRVAFDVCPLNIVANTLTRRIGLEFDKDGELGRKGVVDKDLLQKLNAIPYYKQQPPKSLGREFVDAEILPLFGQRTDIENLLATYYRHAVYQISCAIASAGKCNVLVTGGGVYNSFFIECLKSATMHNLAIPNPIEIELKEAIIFAFLGALRYYGLVNCWKTVTGAACDTIGGAVYRACKQSETEDEL